MATAANRLSRDQAPNGAAAEPVTIPSKATAVATAVAQKFTALHQVAEAGHGFVPTMFAKHHEGGFWGFVKSAPLVAAEHISSVPSRLLQGIDIGSSYLLPTTMSTDDLLSTLATGALSLTNALFRIALLVVSAAAKCGVFAIVAVAGYAIEAALAIAALGLFLVVNATGIPFLYLLSRQHEKEQPSEDLVQGYSAVATQPRASQALNGDVDAESDEEFLQIDPPPVDLAHTPSHGQVGAPAASAAPANDPNAGFRRRWAQFRQVNSNKQANPNESDGEDAPFITPESSPKAAEAPRFVEGKRGQSVAVDEHRSKAKSLSGNASNIDAALKALAATMTPEQQEQYNNSDDLDDL